MKLVRWIYPGYCARSLTESHFFPGSRGSCPQRCGLGHGSENSGSLWSDAGWKLDWLVWSRDLCSTLRSQCAGLFYECVKVSQEHVRPQCSCYSVHGKSQPRALQDVAACFSNTESAKALERVPHEPTQAPDFVKSE